MVVGIVSAPDPGGALVGGAGLHAHHRGERRRPAGDTDVGHPRLGDARCFGGVEEWRQTERLGAAAGADRAVLARRRLGTSGEYIAEEARRRSPWIRRTISIWDVAAPLVIVEAGGRFHRPRRHPSATSGGAILHQRPGAGLRRDPTSWPAIPPRVSGTTVPVETSRRAPRGRCRRARMAQVPLATADATHDARRARGTGAALRGRAPGLRLRAIGGPRSASHRLSRARQPFRAPWWHVPQTQRAGKRRGSRTRRGAGGHRAGRERLRTGRRTVFFLDEIHRFNKARRDSARTPSRTTTITLIAPPPENTWPRSTRCSSPHPPLRAAGAGSGGRPCAAGSARWPPPPAVRRNRLTRPALDFLAALGGTARTALNALGWPARRPRRTGGDGPASLAAEDARRSGGTARPPGRQPLRHHLGLDRATAARTNASLYCLAAVMLEGGEDPQFIVQQMVIPAASRDIGNADPRRSRWHRAAAAVGDPELPNTGSPSPDGGVSIAWPQVRRRQAARCSPAATSPERRCAASRPVRVLTRNDEGFDNPMAGRSAPRPGRAAADGCGDRTPS